MSLKQAGFAALAAAALGAPATAMANADCPAAASAERMEMLDAQISALDARLEQLNALLDQQEDVRRAAMSRAEARIVAAAHQPLAAPWQVDAIVAQAYAEAQASAQTAIALRRAIAAVRAQMNALQHQMHAAADVRLRSSKEPA